jgi:hypothetical protein
MHKDCNIKNFLTPGTSTWVIMKEPPSTDLVEQLKAKQNQEIEEMYKYQTEKFYNDHRWNKQIIELRKQE